MLLRCTNAFGNFTPGDEVEVPDGDVFDTAFFERDEPEPAPVNDKAPAKGESD